MPSNSRKAMPPQPPTPPKLIVPRSEAQQKLEAHIEKGREIVNRPMNSQAEMDTAKADGEKWRDYAIRLLPTLFDTMAVANDYEKKTQEIAIGGSDIPYTKEREIFKPWISYRVRELESILESLELYTESPAVARQPYVANDNNHTPKNPQEAAI